MIISWNLMSEENEKSEILIEWGTEQEIMLDCKIVIIFTGQFSQPKKDYIINSEKKKEKVS